MDCDGVSPHAGASSSSQRKKRVSTEAHHSSAHSAKVERGRVNCQHRQNTLVYYASYCNQLNAKPLELVPRNVSHPSSAPGSDASNDLLRASTPPPPAVVVLVGDSAVVAGSPAESSNARHGGQADYIIICSTLKDGGAETTNDLQEVSIPNSNENFDEDGESLAPKKIKKKL